MRQPFLQYWLGLYKPITTIESCWETLKLTLGKDIIEMHPTCQAFLRNGIRKIKHATKKNTEPNIDQNEPTLAIINPIAETIKSIHPIKLILLLLIS